MECYVDADFTGGWQQADADDTKNVISRTGLVIMYVNCPIFLSIKLQIDIALSTYEAEYIDLLSELREVILLMNFMEEMNVLFPLYISKPDFM